MPTLPYATVRQSRPSRSRLVAWRRRYAKWCALACLLLFLAWAFSLYWGVIYNRLSAERGEAIGNIGIIGGHAEFGMGIYTSIDRLPDWPLQGGWQVGRVTLGTPFAGPRLLRSPGTFQVTVPIWLLMLVMWCPWAALWAATAIRRARQRGATQT